LQIKRSQATSAVEEPGCLVVLAAQFIDTLFGNAHPNGTTRFAVCTCNLHV